MIFDSAMTANERNEAISAAMVLARISEREALSAMLRERGVYGFSFSADGGDDEGFIDRMMPLLADGSPAGADVQSGTVMRADWKAATSTDATSLEDLPLCEVDVRSAAREMVGIWFHERYPFFGTGRNAFKEGVFVLPSEPGQKPGMTDQESLQERSSTPAPGR